MGDRELGDIEFEEDPGTKINFEEAYISFETAGNPILTVSGSNVGIRTTSPSPGILLWGCKLVTINQLD